MSEMGEEIAVATRKYANNPKWAAAISLMTDENKAERTLNDPAASVLIVNYNSGAHLAHTLHALAAQSISDIEVISIDNKSSDGSFASAQAAVAGDERFRFVRRASNIGFAAGNNL